MFSARKLPDGPRGSQVGLASLPKAAATLAGNVFRCTANLGRRANLFSHGVNNNEEFPKKNVLLERTFSGQNNPRMKVKTYLACSL